MVPSGTLRFAASSQEAEGVCALMENPDNIGGRSGYNQHGREEYSRPAFSF